MEISNLLKPYNEKHSIKEVVFALYFAQLIEDFAPWENFQNKMHLKGFNQLEKLNGVKYKINTTDIYDIQSESTGIVGVRWRKNQDSSSIGQLLQLKNLEGQDQCILSFHELSYIRWANFTEAYLSILNDLSLENVINNIPVSALNLTYIDEFTWIDESPIQLNQIFNETSSYLPEYFFNSHFPSLDIAALISEDDSKGFLTERLAIDIQQTIPNTTIVISHTIACGLENIESLHEFCKNNINVYLEKTHLYNKKTLSNLLTREVLSLIDWPITQ